MGKLLYNNKLRMQTLREQGLGAKAIISSCALLRKSALAQLFCVNHALGNLPQHLHAQFVVVRQLPHWWAIPSYITMSVKR